MQDWPRGGTEERVDDPVGVLGPGTRRGRAPPEQVEEGTPARASGTASSSAAMPNEPGCSVQSTAGSMPTDRRSSPDGSSCSPYPRAAGPGGSAPPGRPSRRARPLPARGPFRHDGKEVRQRQLVGAPLAVDLDERDPVPAGRVRALRRRISRS
jgi:hypothetical protein